MIVSKNSSHPQVEDVKVKRTSFQNYLEMMFSHICGDCQTLRPMMLNDLLVLETESDWALSTILEVEYIKPLEEYCEQT